MHYVVMEMADSYNDEVYTMEENGTPVAVFSNKKEAEAECRRLLVGKLAGLQIGCYAYDLDEISDLDENEILEKLPFCDWVGRDFNEWVIPSKLTEQQTAEVAKVFSKLSFFEVIPVK